MNRKLALMLSLPLALLAGQVLAQNQDFSDVEITVHPLADNVYYLEGRGGNIGVLVGDDGVIMVDDQFAPLTEKIVAAIRTLSDKPIRFVINTHVHGDHTGGNENLAKLGVNVMAHDNVRVRLARGVNNGPASPAAALPVITFGDSAALHFNGEDVEIRKVPSAHTDGDSYVYFRNADVLHLGDVFRTTGYPVIDVNNGGTARGTLEALQIAIDMAGPNTKILPGHGVVVNRDAVVEFRDMVAQVTERVSELVRQGMTEEQVIAAKPTADLDERWGDPSRFLSGLYQSLTSER